MNCNRSVNLNNDSCRISSSNSSSGRNHTTTNIHHSSSSSSSSSSETLMSKLARAVFACGSTANPALFASTSIKDTNMYWPYDDNNNNKSNHHHHHINNYNITNDSSMIFTMDERYSLIEKRQDTFCEYTGDSIFSDRRRSDRRDYRTQSHDENELRQ